jgi:hypothetical protein
MKTTLAIMFTAIAFSAPAVNHAHAADYHKASPLEQTKAACEIYADTYRGAQTMTWGAQHARAYDSCMTLRGYAGNQ